jgi:hypothetical protein
VHPERPKDFRRVVVNAIVHELVDIPRQQRRVPKQRQPFEINEHQKPKQSLSRHFRNHKRVEFVAQINGIDVIAFQIAEHYNLNVSFLRWGVDVQRKPWRITAMLRVSHRGGTRLPFHSFYFYGCCPSTRVAVERSTICPSVPMRICPNCPVR